MSHISADFQSNQAHFLLELVDKYRVVNSVRLGAHWCYFQSQVAPWKIFVRLCKMVKKAFKRKNIEKNPEKIKNFRFFFKIWHLQKIHVWKCNKNCLGGQKLCAFYQKYGSFWEKNIVHLFVRFLAKLGAPLSSELLTTLEIPGDFGEI